MIFSVQEMIQVIHKAKLPVRFKCNTNSSGQSTNDLGNIVSQFKMTVHVYTDSAFRRYQKEMRYRTRLLCEENQRLSVVLV